MIKNIFIHFVTMLERVNSQVHQWKFCNLIIPCYILKGLGGVQNFKKSIFFCLFNNTICLEYFLLYGAGMDDSV